jgi:hypothetical protein
MKNVKWWAIGAAVVLIVLIALITFGLFQAGGEDQSTLEKLRDIAIIFIVFISMLIVVLLAAITAALGFLVLQIKDRMIPMLEELTATARRLRGTAEFMSEEAVKPILTVAGGYAKMRGTMRSVFGRDR